VVILDPPTFSTSKSTGVFRVEKDFGKLMGLALPAVKPGGVLLASTNMAQFAPEKFMDIIRSEVLRARRRIMQLHYAPQPPDFPVTRDEPAYLKTVWLRIA